MDHIDTPLLDYLMHMGYRIVILPRAWYVIYRDSFIRGGGHRKPLPRVDYLRLALDSALDDIKWRNEFYERIGHT